MLYKKLITDTGRTYITRRAFNTKNKKSPQLFQSNKIISIRKKLDKEPHDKIYYLKQPYVLEWLYGEPTFTRTLTKNIEHEWGKSIIGYSTNQWTTKLGESILKELLILLGKNPTRVRDPMKSINGKKLLPDFECDDEMYENKARTYSTTGTAGEKVLASALKYCEVPRLYNKPLYIVCMAYQEKEADKCFHLFNPMSEELKDILTYFDEKLDIRYIKATELLEEYMERK